MEREMELLYIRIADKVLEAENTINKNNNNTDDYVSGLANGTIVGMNMVLKIFISQLVNHYHYINMTKRKH